MAAPNDVERFRLSTADGLSLEAEAVVVSGATAAVLLCHPHPEQGGSMTSLVTSELFRTLPTDHALSVLRFNFRGVGASEGAHDHGHGEQLDIVAGLDALAARADGVPLVVAGWSFGADTSLAVLDARIAAWTPIAPPLRILPLDAFVAAQDLRPKVLIVPGNDQFNPPDRARSLIEGWTNARIEVVDGADHFLVGRTPVAARLVADTATTLTPPVSGK